MKKNLLLITLMVLGITFFSCEKKYTTVPPPTPYSSIRDSIKFNFLDAVQEFNFNGGAGGDFTTAEGIEFHIPYYAFRDASNDTVYSTINVKVTEMIDPSDMVLMNKTTTADNEILVTGGQFKIEFTVNDNPVFIGDTLVYIKVPTDIGSSSMNVFNGTEDAEGFVDWAPFDTLGVNVGTDTVGITTNGLTQYYYTLFMDKNSTNWVKCGYYYSLTGDKTSLSYTVNDDQITNANTMMFLHFNNFQSVSSGYFDGKNFFTPKTIPVGANVTVVFISEIDGTYSSKFINTIVGSGSSTSSVTLDPTTYSDLENDIKNL